MAVGGPARPGPNQGVRFPLSRPLKALLVYHQRQEEGWGEHASLRRLKGMREPRRGEG